MIRLTGVTQHYGVRPVLEDISLAIETGERVVVLGPKGMGKTTLLSVIAGVLSPQRGEDWRLASPCRIVPGVLNSQEFIEL